MKIRTWIVALALLPGCGDDTGDTDGSSSADTGAATEPTTGDPVDDPAKVPPTSGHADMQAWLKEGHYKSWKCQMGVQEPISISPHGKQRICSNAILSGHLTQDEYPVDSAAVKELYDDAGANIVGYAVYRHIKAGMTGDDWYWYEQVPDTSPAPHDDNGVVADGPGSMGSAPGQGLCVGCHMATGQDADHPGHDFVYEQVM
ncbi:hypothetical protein [Nannocystis sp.]|uniref:hypothetical protein n=1 Tax=Nannocystis sp. TaxID=1962667 RepID=UPI0025E92537|nr:hypothetical protein [Nannocystis sp.]MBK7829098.1 hypothetical protein [Nannocystis sp.]